MIYSLKDSLLAASWVEMGVEARVETWRPVRG